MYKADLVKEYGITFQQAGEVLRQINQPEITEQCAKKYRYEIWDGATPINGVQPDIITSRKEYPRHIDHRSYLLYKDNNLVYFQYTNPAGITAHMLADDIPDIVSLQIKELASAEAEQLAAQFAKQIMEELF